MPNARATTGVRLDFYTNSHYVTVETCSGHKYEVLIDGILTHQFIQDGEKDVAFTVRFGDNGGVHSGNGMHRVTVILPSHGIGALRNVEIEDGATICRAKFDRKILFFGDSITQGWNSTFDCLSYAYQVSNYFNAESVIQGVGGACFEPEIAIDIGFSPDTVFVAYGTNDFHSGRSLTEITNNAEAFLSNVKNIYGGSKIYLISPIYRMDCENGDRRAQFKDFCGMIKEVAKRAGVKLIDGDTLVPPQKEMMADDLHPNDLGFSSYALNLIKAVQTES